jgi:hypothetical protein
MLTQTHTEQGSSDIIEAGILMLIVMLCMEPAPLIQVKAAWLLINLSSIGM